MEISYATSSSPDLPDSKIGAGVVQQARLIPLDHLSPPSSSATLLFRWKSRVGSMAAVELLELLLPCIHWIRTYRWREYLQMDLVAGVTVGAMLIPQAMSYAKLAGLHPIYGLYSGFVPTFAYAIFGSSRQLSIGPVTLVSLLVSDAVSNIVDPSDELYTELAILLAFMVGVVECIMGLLRLGWLLRFISRSVISGFITASAIVIALSQTKYFLGYNIDRSSEIVPLVKSIIAGAGNSSLPLAAYVTAIKVMPWIFVAISMFSWPPFVMGSTILSIIILMKHLGKTKKNLRFLSSAGPLLAVILGTSFMKVFRPSSISAVGEIPQGFPKFHIPGEFQYAQSLISTAFLITGVAVLESVGIAKALAAKNGYELDPNQELIGLGMANICGSFFSAYPATGAFSRSAVNHDSGAKTGLSGVTVGLTVGCALVSLTPLFADIPQCALAAIVISVGISLVDYEEALFLWHVDKKDFLLWTITCITTLFLGIEIGVLVGVSSSLAYMIHESANPHIAVLGQLPGTTLYRNIEQYPEAYIHDGLLVVRIDAPIYFANASYIKERLQEYQTTKYGPEAEKVCFVIIEMASVPYIDCSAVQALKDLHQEYKSQEIQIAICNPNRKVLQTLSRSGLVEMIGKNWYFVGVHEAVKACLHEMSNLNGTASRTVGNSTAGGQPNLLQKLWTQQCGDDSPLGQEPLLPEKVV